MSTAVPIDLDLGPTSLTAKLIQNSFTSAWDAPPNFSILLGLKWAYDDCGYSYAAEEAEFLYDLEPYYGDPA